MPSETIERREDFDANVVSYPTAIERTVNAVKKRYDVIRIEGVSAHYREHGNEWVAYVEASVRLSEGADE